MPLITIPPVEFDFETHTPKRTVHEHVEPFVARFLKRWGWRPAWIALDQSIADGRMDAGEHVFDHVLDGLRTSGGLAIPTLSLGVDQETKEAATRAVVWDRHGLGVIVRLEDLMRQDVRARVLELVVEAKASVEETDVLIDMGGPAYEPYGGAFRNDSAQMHEHCSAIVSNPRFEFRGADFSYGDGYIAACAAGVKGPSNQTRWKEVGINHHITRVAEDLTNL